MLELTALVKSMAIEEGFARAGIADAAVDIRGERFERWLQSGFCGGMDYMHRTARTRLDVRRLMPSARSVICLAVSYAPAMNEDPAADLVIARYARGRDYHRLLKKRCIRLMDRIRQAAGRFDGRAFVDSAPLAERSLAAAAGVGFIGANGCLIVPGLGSYVLLCEIVCNLPLVCDGPIPSQCDSCGRCAAACPSGALQGDGLVDARACISYLTIEHRGPIDPSRWPAMGNCLFGCDTCQAACPHNSAVPPGEAQLRGESFAPALEQALRWSYEDWDIFTRGRALRRAGHEMFLRNAAIAAGNSTPLAGELLAALKALGERTDESVAAPARWAAGRLGKSI